MGLFAKLFAIGWSERELWNSKGAGRGWFAWWDGREYDGEFSESQRHGIGKYTDCDGSVYEGEWGNNWPIDKVKRTFEDTCLNWLNNRPADNGSARLLSTLLPQKALDKIKSNKQRNRGLGKFIWPDGCVYEGEFRNSQRHGQGKEVQPSGSIYVGNWEHDYPHGYGKYIYSGGSVYEGEWRCGNRDNTFQYTVGLEEYTMADLWEIESGYYVRHGQGRSFAYDGFLVYDGSWRLNKRHGRGVMNDRSGDSYDGEWKDDKPHGFGRYFFHDGSIFEGEWNDGESIGKGQYTDSNGIISEAPCPVRSFLNYV